MSPATPSFVIVEAPSALGLSSKGVEELPGALMSLGLADRLRARHGARIEPPPSDGRRDPGTRLLNANALAAYSAALADQVGSHVAAGDFPIVLGGDCSIVLGCLLALRRRGRYGLFFCDGHADFYQPEAEPKGEAASMDLALATGRGPAIASDLEGRGPLVRDEDVIAFGRRDADEANAHGSQRIEDTPIRTMDLRELRQRGAAAAAQDALTRLTRPELEGYWIHLDADVLDDAVMPAVDYRIPDGLSWDELIAVLRIVVRGGRAAGMSVAILNPTIDPDRSVSRAFVDALSRGLASSPW